MTDVEFAGVNKKGAILLIVLGFLSTIASYLVFFYHMPAEMTLAWILIVALLIDGPLVLVIGIIVLMLLSRTKRDSNTKALQKKTKRMIWDIQKIVKAKERKRELIIKEGKGKLAKKQIYQLDGQISDYLGIIKILEDKNAPINGSKF